MREFRFQLGDLVVHKTNPDVIWCVVHKIDVFKFNAYTLRNIRKTGRFALAERVYEHELEMLNGSRQKAD